MPGGRERLTPRVRRVLAMAEAEAASLRQPEIGTEHVLLAVLLDERGLATRALRELGVEPGELVQRVRARLVRADVGVDGPIGLGPGARSAIRMAHAEAGRLHHDYVGTEHVLLGLLRDGEGPAFVVLNGAGVTLARARQQVVKILDETSSEKPDGSIVGLPSPRGPESRIDRLAERQPRDDEERCGRCGRARRSDWRFCAFCGEPWPTCDRCDAPVSLLAGVRFCPGCGVSFDTDDRA